MKIPRTSRSRSAGFLSPLSSSLPPSSLPPAASFSAPVALLLRVSPLSSSPSLFLFRFLSPPRNCWLNGYARPASMAQVTTPAVERGAGVAAGAVVGIMHRVFHARGVERRCSSVLRAARGCYGLIFSLCPRRPLEPRSLLVSCHLQPPTLFSHPEDTPFQRSRFASLPSTSDLAVSSRKEPFLQRNSSPNYSSLPDTATRRSLPRNLDTALI